MLQPSSDSVDDYFPVETKIALIIYIAIIPFWFHPVTSNAMADSDRELSQLTHYLNIETDGSRSIRSILKQKYDIFLFQKREFKISLCEH